MALDNSNQQGIPGPLGSTRMGSRDDEVLQTALYGGLNTISSRLNIPLEDSPDMRNVYVSQQGDIVKRSGSLSLYNRSGLTDASGTTLIPVAYKNGQTGLIAKEQTSLVVYAYENNALIPVMTKSNVWSSKAAGVRCDFVMTSEVEPRIIMTTGVNVPIQVSLVEHSGSATTPGSYAFSDDRFAQIAATNILYYRNGVRVASGFSVSYSGGTTTLTHGSIAPSDLIDIVFITWQWWSESIKMEGDQIHQHTTRFHVSVDDQNVKISTRITQGVQEAFYGFYGIEVLKSTNYNDPFTFKFDFKPTASTEWNHSQGGRYDKAIADPITPGLAYVTFGDVKPYAGSTPSAPDAVHFLRSVKLTFRGGQGQSANKLLVYVNNRLYTQNTNPTAASGTPSSSPTYYLRDAAWSTTITNPTTVGAYVSFTATNPVGMSPESVVEIINAEVDVTVVGTAALSERTDFKDGSIFAAYGLGVVADYSRGSFPRTVTIYQGRIVFGGFPSNPMMVLMSNVLDSTRAGTFYNNYQTSLERGLSTDAVDVLIANTIDDLITGLIEYQNNLFVFTRKAIYRIHGGQTGTITPTNTFLNYIAALGAVNPLSVIKVDKTVLFLSSSGVYDITPTVEAGDYTAGERSIKIRNLLSSVNTPYNEGTAWMMYDSLNEDVYVSVSGVNQPYVSDHLYVYSTIRGAWTEYSTTGGVWHSFHGALLVSSSNQVTPIIASTKYISFSTAPTNIEYLRLRSAYYFDQVTHYTVSGSSAFEIVTHIPVRKLTYTTKAWKMEYPTAIEETGDGRGFRILDVTSIQDCEVYLNGSKLVFGDDWVKTHKSTVYLLTLPGDGNTLTIEQRAQDNTYPVVVYRDKVKLAQGVDYTVSEDVTSGCYKLTFASGVNGAILTYGSLYPSYHKSPLFLRESLHKLKNLTHYIGYFDNTIGQDVYTDHDVNAASFQNYEEIIGRYKVLLNFNLVFIYEELDEGFSTADVYGFSDIYWDVASFDITPSSRQYKRFARMVEPIIGTSYAFQSMIWAFSDTAFDLVGYQITTSSKSKSSLSYGD
jgi:hypothetical protein